MKCYHLEKNKNLKRNSKLPEGLAASLDEGVASNLRFFSLNVDECISNANEKVFSMIVSYFSESLQCVVVHHYNLKRFTVVNIANLFDHVQGYTVKKFPFLFGKYIEQLFSDICAAM